MQGFLGALMLNLDLLCHVLKPQRDYHRSREAFSQFSNSKSSIRYHTFKPHHYVLNSHIQHTKTLQVCPQVVSTLITQQKLPWSSKTEKKFVKIDAKGTTLASDPCGEFSAA